MTKARCYPCARHGCRQRAVRDGCYCSRSCARTDYLLTRCTPAERSAQMRRARALQQQQAVNRMLQRVKVLADDEDTRLVLAWRLGKGCAKSQRYRVRQATHA